MKKIFYFTLFSAFVPSAFAIPSLYCEYSAADEPYYFSFENQNSTAQVKINQDLPDFGNLKCNKTELNEGDEGLRYICNSVNVNDAGYRVELFWEAAEDFTVEIYEVSIAGLKPLKTLPCWAK